MRSLGRDFSLFAGKHPTSLRVMKSPPWMLFGLLLALPAIGWSQEKSEHSVITTKPAANAVTPPERSHFRVNDENVRRILLAAARDTSTENADELETPDSAGDPPSDLTRRLALKFNDRRVDHVDCDALQCAAYSRSGDLLYTTPRNPTFGESDLPADHSAWLSCQDSNDLLSTFERFDLCRGLRAGVPLEWRGGEFTPPRSGITRYTADPP